MRLIHREDADKASARAAGLLGPALGLLARLEDEEFTLLAERNLSVHDYHAAEMLGCSSSVRLLLSKGHVSPAFMVLRHMLENVACYEYLKSNSGGEVYEYLTAPEYRRYTLFKKYCKSLDGGDELLHLWTCCCRFAHSGSSQYSLHARVVDDDGERRPVQFLVVGADFHPRFLTTAVKLAFKLLFRLAEGLTIDAQAPTGLVSVMAEVAVHLRKLDEETTQAQLPFDSEFKEYLKFYEELFEETDASIARVHKFLR